MSGSIVLLSGPPAAGKSTVAAALAATAPGFCANIEGDKFWFFLAKGRLDRNAHAQLIMRAMLMAARPYAGAGAEAIVDFAIGPWFLPALRPLAGDAPVDFIVLCPSLEECVRRAAGRKEGVIDYGPYRELHEAFATVKGFEKHMITEDHASAEDVAAKIRAGLAAGAYRLA
jgi:chloramphenicol 3-O-phosphotransferase